MKIQAGLDVYAQIASGKRINTAADDAAGLAISEKLNSQVKGDQKAIQNIGSSVDLLNTAESALGGISDNLGQIRELTVQAQNSFLTDDDKSAIQSQVNQLLSDIKDQVKNTTFNTQKLIDGSFTDRNLGVGANGQGTEMTLQDSGLEAIGMDGFKVTDDDALSTVSNAMNTINKSRSEIGASTNGLEANLNRTRISEYNQTAAQSNIEDLDIAKALMELNKQKITQQYQYAIQNKQAEQEQNKLGLLI